MKILALGDVVGSIGISAICENLSLLKREYGAKFTIVNGENADMVGITPEQADTLFKAGVDVITLGNHTYRKADICELLCGDANIIRPANYPPMAPGGGRLIFEAKGKRVLCINVLGVAFMEALACPFETVDRILDEERGNYDIAVLDIHAEATSEKIALGRYFDGRINVIFGTHTHVPTADEQILPKGSGYITDLGMCGPVGGVLGTDATAVIDKMRTKMPTRFTVASGEIRANGALFETDDTTGRVKSIRRVRF